VTTADDAQQQPSGSEQPAPAAHRDNSLGRKILIWVLIILGCIGLIASVFGIWAHNLIFDEDRWADTLEPVVRDPEVTATLADRVSTAVVDALGIQQRVEQRLPNRLGFAAPAIAEATRDLLDRRLTTLFSREGVQDAWLAAVSFVQQQVIRILRDETTAIQTEGGKIVLNLFPLIQVALNEVQRLGLLPDDVTVPKLDVSSPEQARQQLGQALGRDLQPGFGTVPLADGQKVEQAQQWVRWFDRLVWILPILTLVFLAAAILLSRRQLRTALWMGAAVAVSLLATRLLIEFAQRKIVDAIAESQGVEDAPVSAAVLSSITNGLRQVTAGLVVLGVVAVVLAFLAERLHWFEPAQPAPRVAEVPGT
jgi:hypothetical protein